ncbi:MAG TPA: malonyl-CoA decarboxylase family protein [Acidimicrobiales bacterium]
MATLPQRLAGLRPANPPDEVAAVVAELVEAVASGASPEELVVEVAPGAAGVAPLVAARSLTETSVQGSAMALDGALRGGLRERLDGAVVRRVSIDDPDEVHAQIAAGDTVYPITGPEDLGRRLAEDRRIFALEHAGLEGTVLAFVEVALWNGLAGDIGAVLRGPVVPSGADTAIFYSINRCAPGLRGVGAGGLLLERAIPLIEGVECYSTLSPIPGLRAWVEGRRVLGGVHMLLADDSWPPATAPVDAAAREWLMGVTARYLTITETRRVPDPVGNFHLRNGAEVARVCWAGDLSPRGRQRSWGLMVNYRYEPRLLEARAAAYSRGEVAVADAVRRLMA